MNQWICSGALCLSLALGGCDNTAQSDRRNGGNNASIETFSLGITGDLVNLPWRLAERGGLLDEIERSHGIRVDTVEFATERRALQAYESGDIDALTTSLNAIVSSLEITRHETTMPLIFGFSRGDHGIFSRSLRSPQALAGQRVHLPLGSASHYLLFRILELNQLTLGDLQLIDTPEEQLITDLISGEIETLVAAGANFSQLQGLDGVQLLADSRSLYGEIMAGIAIDAGTMQRHPGLAAALVEGWFVIMADMFNENDQLNEAYVEQAAMLSNLPAAVIHRYLGAHNYLRTPEHALRYMQGDNLRPAIFGTQRFREASSMHECSAKSAIRCGIERDDNIITHGDGARIILNTSVLQAITGAE